jgi:hypothetical protein
MLLQKHQHGTERVDLRRQHLHLRTAIRAVCPAWRSERTWRSSRGHGSAAVHVRAAARSTGTSPAPPGKVRGAPGSATSRASGRVSLAHPVSVDVVSACRSRTACPLGGRDTAAAPPPRGRRTWRSHSRSLTDIQQSAGRKYYAVRERGGSSRGRRCASSRPTPSPAQKLTRLPWRSTPRVYALCTGVPRAPRPLPTSAFST